MKIALLGANGQLAHDLKRALKNHQIVPLTREDFDVTDHARMSERLGEAEPEVIINTTAFHRVDDCETEVAKAFAVNAEAVFHMANVANGLGARLVHISTDYVFDGESTSPYTESDAPRPISVYANSKAAGEYFVRSVASDHLLIRTCGLYGVAGSSGKGGNFVETMLRKGNAGEALRVVSDQIVSPTPTRDLAAQMKVLIEGNHQGLFHASADGGCSWYEFARTIFEVAGLEVSLEPATSASYPTPARRPAFSVLENARLKQLGLNRMRYWRQGLADYLKEKHGFEARARAAKKS